MRFKDLSPAAVKCLWDRWKYSVERVLYDLNEDVFGGNGSIQENSYSERSYISLQTKEQCVYIFPIQGNRLLIGVSRGKLEKEHLRLNSKASKFEPENLIDSIRLQVDPEDSWFGTTENRLWCLEQALKLLYKKHWSSLSF